MGDADRHGIDVVIPTYGGWAVTESCLRHLRAQTVAHRVTVVDNRSPDDTVARLRDGWPEVAVVEMPGNDGFAAACNAGIAATSGAAVVLLNNDVDAAPDMLERLVAPLMDDPRLGSVAPVLLRPDGRIDSVGLCTDSTIAGFPRLQGAPEGSATDARPTLLGPSGAAAAYRRSALDAVGGLDERIFMYQEDLDLALRLRAGGWGAAVAAAARGVHLGSATSGRRSAAQRRRAGFARGYLLRRYGVLRGRAGLRAILTEAIVCGGDAVISRDLEATLGRLAGWRAGRRARRLLPRDGVDRSIGFRDSLALRRGDYALAD